MPLTSIEKVPQPIESSLIGGSHSIVRGTYGEVVRVSERLARIAKAFWDREDLKWAFPYFYSFVVNEVISRYDECEFKHRDVVLDWVVNLYDLYALNLQSWVTSGTADSAWVTAFSGPERLSKDQPWGRRSVAALMLGMFAQVRSDLPRVLAFSFLKFHSGKSHLMRTPAYDDFRPDFNIISRVVIPQVLQRITLGRELIPGIILVLPKRLRERFLKYFSLGSRFHREWEEGWKIGREYSQDSKVVDSVAQLSVRDSTRVLRLGYERAVPDRSLSPDESGVTQLGHWTGAAVRKGLIESWDETSPEEEFLYDREGSIEKATEYLLRVKSSREADPEPGLSLAEQGVSQAQREWNANPIIHVHFRGFQGYAQLRPLYAARGVANPAQWISNHIVSVQFFGRATPAHMDLAAPLQAAERTLRTLGCIPRFLSGGRGFWGFVPRRISGTQRLSRHAFGRAVDINHPENPHVVDQDEIQVIRTVTCVDLSQRQSAAMLRWADRQFRANFNQRHLLQLNRRLHLLLQKPRQTRTAADRREIDRLRGVMSNLSQYAQNGFLNLEQPLIEALVTAGFTWGGQWQSHKDFMHFEL